MKRILVVEDDCLVRRDICEMVSRFGYQIAAAVGSGEDAITEAQATTPDLALLDIRLDGKIDGITVGQFLTKVTKMPVIYVSALEDDETFCRARQTKPYGFLQKPISWPELRFALGLASDSLSSPEPNLERDAHSSISYPSTGLSKADVICTEFITKHPALRGLPHRALEELKLQCSIENFKAGQDISLNGLRGPLGFLVIEGLVIASLDHGSGEELVVDAIGEHDLLGVLYAVDGGIKPAILRAQKASKLAVLTKPGLRKLIELDARLYSSIVTELGQRLEQAYRSMACFARGNAEEKIIQALSTLVSRLGLSSQNNALYVTRKELASYAGIAVETAFRVTKQLENAGVISLAKPGQVLLCDFEALGCRNQLSGRLSH